LSCKYLCLFFEPLGTTLVCTPSVSFYKTLKVFTYNISYATKLFEFPVLPRIISHVSPHSPSPASGLILHSLARISPRAGGRPLTRHRISRSPPAPPHLAFPSNATASRVPDHPYSSPHRRARLKGIVGGQRLFFLCRRYAAAASASAGDDAGVRGGSGSTLPLKCWWARRRWICVRRIRWRGSTKSAPRSASRPPAAVGVRLLSWRK
jgi:hypothetical protein